ncbi:hypothetical protein GIB67_018851 [Kingdonia uniflora]|uniref:HAT C-terminal dimerisation domain-containing protein n=1 Tax=Kingdonia uniflora TaxID=39325 RepID=A0A7J7NE29_9MAGN|nr:hypothetical protein GIB67_018851 [Kingdonia uniflora]
MGSAMQEGLPTKTNLTHGNLEDVICLDATRKKKLLRMCSSTACKIIKDICSLAPTTVEALICTQDWLRPSMVPINLRDSMNEVEELDKELLGGSNLHPSFVED